jgi:hypothetical protein
VQKADFSKAARERDYALARDFRARLRAAGVTRANEMAIYALLAAAAIRDCATDPKHADEGVMLMEESISQYVRLPEGARIL